MPEKNTNRLKINIKNILLINCNTGSLFKEIQFLKNEDFTLVTASDKTGALHILESKDLPIDLVLLDPMLSSLKEGLETAEAIIAEYQIPLLFYTEQNDRKIIGATDDIDHFGIVCISSGPAILLSSIIRVSKALQRYKDLLEPEDPISRLVERITESNKINQKSDYGNLTAELVDAVIIDDPDGNIIIANNKASQILGLSIEQIKNNEIYKSNWRFVHEDLTPFLPEEHPHIIAKSTGKAHKNIIMGIDRPEQATQWLSNSSLPIFTADGENLTGVATYFYDITDLISAKKNNIRWANIFHHADWGIVVGPANSNSLDMMNPAYASMHGYTINELQGKPVFDVFAPEYRKNAPAHMKLANKNGHHRFESIHIRKDGSKFPAIMDITTVKDQNGTPLYRAVNVLDITEQKKQEKKLRDALEELKKAKEYSDTLFSNSPIAIYSVDQDSRMVNFNKKAEEITGYKQ